MYINIKSLPEELKHQITNNAVFIISEDRKKLKDMIKKTSTPLSLKRKVEKNKEEIV